MAVQKDILRLSKAIIEGREWEFLDREYPDKERRNHKKSILAEIYKNDLDPQKDMVRMYEEGVTCTELGRLFNRAFQSVARSLRNYGKEDTQGKHKENRKEWVRLVKKYEIVHLSDMAGSYEMLMAEYKITLEKAKDMYRRAGGSVLIRREKSLDENLDTRICELVDAGYTGVEISKILSMPVTTVYYRINTRVNPQEGG